MSMGLSTKFYADNYPNLDFSNKVEQPQNVYLQGFKGGTLLMQN